MNSRNGKHQVTLKLKIERKNGQRVCFIAANSELYHLAFDIIDYKNCVYPVHVV